MTNKRLYIATTKNGGRVYADPDTSHAATHLVDTPKLLELVKELIQNIEAGGDSVYLDKDMGQIVGTTDLVETTDDDQIVYAKRLNRDNYTRFALKRKAEPTSFVTIVLKKSGASEYELWSAWIGRAVPQFPGDEYETPESRPFWRTHALVWGNQAVQPETEQHEWPWCVDDQPSSISRTSSTSKPQLSSSKV